jgi:hypothetical protein
LTKLRGKRVDALQRDLVCRHLLLQRLQLGPVILRLFLESLLGLARLL